MRLAYLLNQYPKVSHSFIRREILALEAQGAEIIRIAARGWDAELADDQDVSEQKRTRYLLAGGPGALALALLRTVLSRPRLFFLALFQATRLGWHADRPLIVHWIYLAEACVALEWLRAQQVQHVHAHFGTNATEIALLVHALGGPEFSFTVHGPEEFDHPRELKLPEKIAVSKFVAAISAYGRSQLYRWLPHPLWEKVKEIHCGLDDVFLDAELHPVPIGTVPKLVCVGRLCEQKGQLLLVQAAHELRHSGKEFELVLAGDGDMRGEIESLIQKYRLEDSVRITGWVSAQEVKAELLSARALVLPSFAEGLPVVIMEALALQRPVISTYIAGIPELVIDGENGWLVPAGSIEPLADAIISCLEATPEQLKQMGENGRQAVLERHDVNKEAIKLLSLIE